MQGQPAGQLDWPIPLEQHAAAIGFNEGKAYARKQILRLFVFGIVGWIFGSEILWPWVRSLY